MTTQAQDQLAQLVQLRSKIGIWCPELASLLYLPIAVASSDTLVTTNGTWLYFGQQFFQIEDKRVQLHHMMRLYMNTLLNHVDRGNEIAPSKDDKEIWSDAVEMITNGALSKLSWVTQPSDALLFEEALSSDKLEDLPPLTELSAPHLFRILNEAGYQSSGKSPSLLMSPDEKDQQKSQVLIVRGDVDESDVNKPSTSNDVAERLEQELHRLKLEDILAGAGSDSFLMNLLADMPEAPRTPWELELKSLMLGPLSQHYKSMWSKPSRRMASGGLPNGAFIPSYEKTTGLKIAIVDMDLSGSCFEPELITRWAQEIASIQEQTGCEVIFRSFDSEIKDVYKVSNDRTSFVEKVRSGMLELHGGGGTDFRPLFEKEYTNSEGEEFTLDPVVQIILTDLCGPTPEDQPNHLVIWVGMDDTINESDVPFGKLVKLF